MKFSTPRGTRDILPEENYQLRRIGAKFSEILYNYNFKEIKTPIFEQIELFKRAVGDDTDIVSKEMYAFTDKGGRELTLRPEGTAAIVRSYLQHGNYFQKQKVTKLFYTGPMFRYERPQSGRYRQFYQFGVEAIGSASPYLDAEVIMLAINMLKSIGVDDAEVAINSVGCEVCRPVIREQLKGFVESILGNLCDDCNNRYETNPLRILDCKNKTCQTYFAGMPDMSSALCHSCNDHYIGVLNTLDANNVKYVVDSNLVRGLDYYTKTVFEVRSSLLGAQNAILGGGRYDNLISEFGGRKTPAFGFAIGLDRLVMLLDKLEIQKDVDKTLDFFLIGNNENELEVAFTLMNKLREAGRKCEFSFKKNSMGKSIKEAINLGAKYAIIIGDEEVEGGYYTVKDLGTKQQYKLKSLQEVVGLKS